MWRSYPNKKYTPKKKSDQLHVEQSWTFQINNRNEQIQSMDREQLVVVKTNNFKAVRKPTESGNPSLTMLKISLENVQSSVKEKI